jgi:hypothetical protein
MTRKSHQARIRRRKKTRRAVLLRRAIKIRSQQLRARKPSLLPVIQIQIKLLASRVDLESELKSQPDLVSKTGGDQVPPGGQNLG